jgi:hypothetical protein
LAETTAIKEKYIGKSEVETFIHECVVCPIFNGEDEPREGKFAHAVSGRAFSEVSQPAINIGVALKGR